MSHIRIHREHHLGLAKARKIAYRWAEDAERDLGMTCSYEEGARHDEVQFTRTGASGSLRVTAESFELDAKLGFLLGAFKDRIESEIVRNLDSLLSPKAAKAPPAAKAPARKKA